MGVTRAREEGCMPESAKERGRGGGEEERGGGEEGDEEEEGEERNSFGSAFRKMCVFELSKMVGLRRI